LYFLILNKVVLKSDYKNRCIFNMTQNSMNTPYAKRVAEKFKEAFAEKYCLKKEEIKKGIVDKVYNQ